MFNAQDMARLTGAENPRITCSPLEVCFPQPKYWRSGPPVTEAMLGATNTISRG